MNAAQHRALSEYFREIADGLSLKDWVVKVDRHEPPSEEDSIAEIYPTDGKRHAVVYLNPDFLTRSPDEQRRTVVHELLHCHFDSAGRILTDDLEPLIGSVVTSAVGGTYQRLIEIAIEDLAVAIAPFFALPELPPLD